MSRLKKFAKETSNEIHQYPLKINLETFLLFSSYCESLKLSVNESLNILIQEEIKEYKKTFDEESLNKLIQDYKKKQKKRSRNTPKNKPKNKSKS
jgi:hypothetical protein